MTIFLFIVILANVLYNKKYKIFYLRCKSSFLLLNHKEKRIANFPKMLIFKSFDVKSNNFKIYILFLYARFFCFSFLFTFGIPKTLIDEAYT